MKAWALTSASRSTHSGWFSSRRWLWPCSPGWDVKAKEPSHHQDRLWATDLHIIGSRMIAAVKAGNNGTEKVSIWWLIGSYGVVTIGELFPNHGPFAGFQTKPGTNHYPWWWADGSYPLPSEINSAGYWPANGINMITNKPTISGWTLSCCLLLLCFCSWCLNGWTGDEGRKEYRKCKIFKGVLYQYVLVLIIVENSL